MPETKNMRRQHALRANDRKLIYAFGRSRVDGAKEMRELLGAKGATLAEMTAIGLPIPPGFTITSEACAEFHRDGHQLSDHLLAEIRRYMAHVEQEKHHAFGSAQNPLLVSVRTSAAVPIPGLLDTVPNIGINDEICHGLAQVTGCARFARDTYRRLIEMFAQVVMGVSREPFEQRLQQVIESCDAANAAELKPAALDQLIAAYKDAYKSATGDDFPQDPWQQLHMAIAAAFKSWESPRAQRYRALHEISALLGAAVHAQAMVFGNVDQTSGCGVAFTRDPATGRNELSGEFLVNAQGADVVAGLRPPRPLAEMRHWRADAWQQLLRIKERLERHCRDMQEIEFTIERGAMWMLQTRRSKRTGAAAVKIACDMAREKLVEREEAINRVPPADLLQLLSPSFEPESRRDVIATGLPASPGAAVGQPVFSSYEAMERGRNGEKVILVLRETTPEDVDGMWFAEGVVTTLGGMTCHAAVVCRGWGKPAVTGCSNLQINPDARTIRLDGRVLSADDTLSIDGSTGEVMIGKLPTRQPAIEGDFARLLKWADSTRRLRVRANADTPAEARIAREVGAEGIGLCKTENMWFEEDRITLMRQMILADNVEDRQRALDQILPVQRTDFVEIFRAMEGLPVTIRLLDPPLSDFLPRGQAAQAKLADQMKLPLERVAARVAQLEEANPMLGHRGARLCVTYPEILQMQVRAAAQAAIDCRRMRVNAQPEIMLPLIGTEREMRMVRTMTQDVIEQVRSENSFGRLDIPVGAMIEVPRAAVTADRIAECADFFSFGTNDLTQMTFGYSRDDVSAFLPAYLRAEVLERDPFQSLDVEGVGRLMTMAIVRGRSCRPGLKCGICGPHGGDPASIAFFHEIGMDYVSCKPLRIPVARLAAAQAALKRR